MAGDLSGGGRSGGRFSHRPCHFQPDNKMKPKFRVHAGSTRRPEGKSKPRSLLSFPVETSIINGSPSLHAAVVPPRSKLFCGESQGSHNEQPTLYKSARSLQQVASPQPPESYSNPHSTATSQACLRQHPSLHGQGCPRACVRITTPTSVLLFPSTVNQQKSSSRNHSLSAVHIHSLCQSLSGG
jgi:hypothetical protein